MESPFAEKAIPMVTVDEKTNKYQLTQEATNFFQAIQGPIAVVSVAGLYRTGKSYLLNRVLLDRSNGFGVGPTVQACTKGLWCWGKPIKGTSSDGQSVTIVVIDSEGIGALDEDQTHDTKIFTLAILASSVFIYNSMGSIDQNAIQNLSLVVNLTKNIQLREQPDEDGVDPDEVSTYFPTFYWVVRDFSLQLQDTEGNPISSKEYLERALAPANGFSDDIEEKNRIRRLLTAFFKERDCYTMVRPLVDEEKLQTLDKMDLKELRPEFATQAINLRQKIKNGIKPKCMEDKKLNGTLYLSMMSSYVEAINDGAVPNIENAWNYMCLEQCERAERECFEIFTERIKYMLGSDACFPTSEKELNRCIDEAREEALEAFRQKSLGDHSAASLKQLKKEINGQIETIKLENVSQSEKKLKEYIHKVIDRKLTSKIKNNEYDGNHQKLYEDIKQVGEIFDREGPKFQGYEKLYPAALQKFASQGSLKIIGNLKKTHENHEKLLKTKEEDQRRQLELLKDEKDSLIKEKKELENMMDSQRAELTSKLEATRDNLEMEKQAKQMGEQEMERQFNDKRSELVKNYKQMEIKLEEVTAELNKRELKMIEDSKQWEKEKAITQNELKRQAERIEELLNKEKSLDKNKVSMEQEMKERVKEMTVKHEKERSDMINKIKALTEKTEELEGDMTDLKEKLDKSEIDYDTAKRRFKDDMNKKKADVSELMNKLESMEREYSSAMETQRMEWNIASNKKESEIKGQYDKIKQRYDQLSQERKQLVKQLQMARNDVHNRQEQLNIEIEAAEKYRVQQESTMNAMKEFYSKENSNNLDKVLDEKQREYENSLNELQSKAEQQINNLRINLKMKEEQLSGKELEFDNKVKQLSLRVNELTENNKELEDKLEMTKNEAMRNMDEERDSFKEFEMTLKRKLEEAEQELEEEKENHMNAMAETTEKYQEMLKNLNCSHKMELEGINKKLSKQKEDADARYEQLDKRREEELQDLQADYEDSYQQLEDNYHNERETNKQIVSKMQQDQSLLETNLKNLDAAHRDAKQTLEKKEREFNEKMDKVTTDNKIEKEKLEQQVADLKNNCNLKEKELLNLSHEREQLTVALEKKDKQQRETTEELERLHHSTAEKIKRLEETVSEHEKNYMTIASELGTVKATSAQKIQYLEQDKVSVQKERESELSQHQAFVAQLKEEMKSELDAKTAKLTNQRQELERKSKEQKKELKQMDADFKRREEELKRSLRELSDRHIALETRSHEQEAKYSQKEAKMSQQIKQARERIQVVEQQREEERRVLNSKIAELEHDNSELKSDMEREQAINKQQREHQEELKNRKEQDHEREVRDLRKELEKQSSQTNQAKNQYREGMTTKERELESRHTEKVRMIQENHNNYKAEIEARLKVVESENKELKKQVSEDMTSRNNMERANDRRFANLSKEMEALMSQNDKLKKSKDTMETNHREELFKKDEKYKKKLGEMERKITEFQTKNQNMLVETEIEKTKMRTQKEELINKLSEKEDELRVAKQTRDRARLPAMERSKRGEVRGKNGGHSFVSTMKSEYNPASKARTARKMEDSQPPEENKENAESNRMVNVEGSATDL